MVDFGDEDDDEGRRRRRKKFATQGSGGEGGGDGAHGGGHQGKQAGKGKGKGGKGAAATSLVKHVPGKLTHAEVGESAAEIFGDGGMADEQEEEEEEAVLEAGDEEGEDEDVGEAEDGEEGGRAIVTASAAAAAPGSWESLGVTATFAPHLVSLGYSRPTKVQCGTLPVLLGRKDALVRAATGSGKTLCYLVPIIQDLAGQVRGEGGVLADCVCVREGGREGVKERLGCVFVIMHARTRVCVWYLSGFVVSIALLWLQGSIA